MAFVRKHLPDKFYQEGEQRISLRDRIFREVVGNLLIHREFANAFPAKFIIEKDRVLTENWNRPHAAPSGSLWRTKDGGVIDPVNFSPYPKNPVIAKFFKEIGRVDELGSGVRNTFKYCGIYTPGTKPEFIEDDVFRTIIPLKSENGATQITTQIATQMTTQIISEKILELLRQNPTMSRKKLAELLGDITEDGVKYPFGQTERSGKNKSFR
jgi:ATP-dependent DNA helicase RecG